ncbi:MAG: hypothetical protein ABEJ56_05535 [Candidatus Nanohaloarchaea archaeon]
MKRQQFLLGGVAAVALAALFGSGMLSFASNPGFDINGQSCSGSGDSFACSFNGVNEQFSDFTGATIGEAELFELDENGARGLLSERNIIVQDQDGNGVAFNGSNWQGSCLATVGFEDDDRVRVEVQIPGKLVSSSALGCSLDSVDRSEVRVTMCNPEPSVESCRSYLGSADSEYSRVSYSLRNDRDGDGVFDRSDECPGTAGRLESGCRNSKPVITVFDVPSRVEDEEVFNVSVRARDEDLEQQDLSYSWSNGETGRTASYSFVVGGVSRNVSVSVSDGLDSVSRSKSVRVVDSGGSRTGFFEGLVEWVLNLF